MLTHAVTPPLSREKIRLFRLSDVLQMVLSVLLRVEVWWDHRAQRRALLKFSINALKDIGLSAADADREGFKPFWQD